MIKDPYRLLMQDYEDVLKSGAEFSVGWIPVMRRILDEMISTLTARGFQRSDLRIVRMREKNGMLRCYYRGPIDLDHIVDKYEDKSAKICEQCSEPGKLRMNQFITCMCDSCAHKYKLDEAGSESLIKRRSDGNDEESTVGMRKIVLNDQCWFAPSLLAMQTYAGLKNITLYDSEESWGHTRYWTVPPEHRPAKPDLNDKDRAAQNDYYAFEKRYLLDPRKIPRDDLHFVVVVEGLGDFASDENCKLKIVEIPDDVKWYIEDVGHSEIIHEEHRTWH